ncbi:MAG: tetratricopeptide repeat protein [Janthinobacterium lividum]
MTLKHARSFSQVIRYATLAVVLNLPAVCLSGCHLGQQDRSDFAAVLPAVSVVPLHSKLPGDTGKKIVRLDSEDQPTITAYNGPEHKNAALLAQWIPVEQLPQSAASPGLVVCEPVAAKTNAATADFGAGCGRWLHFTVAGLPQMGQTPLWSSLERAESEMGRTDLRLTLPDAQRLSSVLGVNYAAVGRITGTAAHCTLSYQLCVVPDGILAGKPLIASGTQAQIVSQLPALARQMALSLGVSAPSLPTAVQATPAGIGMLGRLAWYPDDNLPAVQTHQLQTMAARLPLAGLFLVNTTGDLNSAQWNAAANALLKQQPNNALVWAQIGFSAPSLLVSQAQLASNVRLFPKNYLFATADTWVQRRLLNDNAELQSAETTVQNAPHNPDGWLTLGSTISQEGDRVRQSRLATDIPAKEWQFLNSAYPQWYYSVSQAAQLDPLDVKAWNRVAEAATFAGHPRQADQALWKDIALDKTDPDAYAWGLQMYQSKWDGDSEKLQQVVQDLATIHYPTVAQGLYAVKILRDNEETPDQYLDQRRALLSQLLTRTQQAIAQNPGDAQAHYDQAYALSLAGHKSKAISEYKNVVVLRPADSQAYFDLAQEYDQQGAITPAIAAYRQGLTLEPASASGYYNLGWDLKEQGHFPQADAQMRQAIKIAPFYPEAHAGLALALIGEHKNKEATAEMLQAVHLNPFLVPAVGELCNMLDGDGRYAESLAMGRHAVQINPNDNDSMDTMADDYLHFKLWDRSIQMSQAALQVNANDAMAHENLGEAYIGQGKKAEAQAEWQQVLTMDHGIVAPAARRMLAKYP